MTALPIRWTRPEVCCGSPMARGTRYEVVRTVDVFLCWTCGQETPALYRRSARGRNGVPYPIASVCSSCARTFGNPINRSDRTIYCSEVCKPLPPGAFGRQERAS